MNSELICKSLQSLDRRERLRGLNDLLEFSQSADNSTEEVVSLYNLTYLYILKCYSDKYESCRELACEVVTEFIQKLPINDYYLQYVVSTLASRIGQKETLEDSEELRLQFLIQLDFLIDKYREDKSAGSDLLLKCYNEIVDILIKELKDKFPAAQREACNCIRTLSEATPSFHYRAEALVAPLIGMLHHKHSMNRIDAIELLGIVSLHITSNNDLISQIIIEISPLLMESMPLVRKECGRAGCRMLMELRDRYSFFPRILPLVLCCLNDDTPEVHDEINALWKKCGMLYNEENENELKKKEVIDECPQRYPDSIQRPSLGCREMVQRSLRMVQLILKEVGDWKEEVRLHSLKLFWQVALHGEDLLTVYILDIFPVISCVCADVEKGVAKEALKCAELMGMLMVYNDWFSYCLSTTRENPRLGYLKCFYSMFAAAFNYSCKDHVQDIARTLQERDFSHSLQPEFQSYLLKFVDVLSKKDPCEIPIESALGDLTLSSENKTEQYLYHIVLKVMSLSYDLCDQNLHEGRELLLKLADGEESKIRSLHSKYMNSVLETFDCLDASNDGSSEPILLLHGIICICGFQNDYVEQMKQCIRTVWKHGAADGKVKVFSAISIAMMSWNANISTELENSTTVLRNFINDIVTPQLVWKAGAEAESLRAMATATLCSMALGAPQEASTVLSELVAQLTSLIDDNNTTTRVYALRSLTNIGPVKSNELRTLGYACAFFQHFGFLQQDMILGQLQAVAMIYSLLKIPSLLFLERFIPPSLRIQTESLLKSVLQRLDDPSSEVRRWAARSIVKVRVDENDIEGANIEGRNKFLHDVFAMLFLHLDGPELKLANTAKNSIIELGKIHKDVFQCAFNKAYPTVGVKDQMDEIKSLTLC